MKHFIIPSLLCILLASCSTVQKTSSQDKRSSDSLAAHTAAQSELKTTKETVDTVLTVKPDTLKGGAQITPPDQSKPDKPQVHELESNNIAVKATYNPRTGKLDIEARTKPKKIPVKINREITEAKHTTEAKVIATANRSDYTHNEQVRKAPDVPWYLNLRNWFWILFVLAILYVVIRNRISIISLIRRVI
jgi:hypothetical protein